MSTTSAPRTFNTSQRRTVLAWLLACTGLGACGQQHEGPVAEVTPDGRPSSYTWFASAQAEALYDAAAKGDMDGARQLMAQGVSLNSANAKEQTLLKVAMLKGDRKAFAHLLDLGADPTYLGNADQTHMHLAAKLENPYWLKTMLERGASTEALDKMGETPLFDALGPRTSESVKLLLAAGANINAKNSSKQTLLHKASNINAFSDVVRFLEHGVDPSAKDDLGNTFQPSFFMNPERILNAEAKDARAKVRSWLRAHNIPIEDSGKN